MCRSCIVFGKGEKQTAVGFASALYARLLIQGFTASLTDNHYFSSAEQHISGYAHDHSSYPKMY